MGAGSCRHREQTGIRETSWRTSPQTRHSSAKIRLNRAQKVFSAALSAPAGHADQLLLGSRLLEKTHLHRTHNNTSVQRTCTIIQMNARLRPLVVAAD